MKRTTPQNNALHRALREVAQEMYMQNLDMRKVIKVPVRPTMENVKGRMLKPIMTALYPEVKSTTQLTTTQVSELWDVFSGLMQDRFGIYVQLTKDEDENL